MNGEFGDDVRAVVRCAQERARELGHPTIDCEHLLFALAKSATSTGAVARRHGLTPARVAERTSQLLAGPRSVFDVLDADALAAIGVDLQAVREAAESTFGIRTTHPARRRRSWRQPRLRGHLSLSGRARRCLDRAGFEAIRSTSGLIESAHLGVALVDTDGGLVPPILNSLGVSAPQLRAALLALE